MPRMPSQAEINKAYKDAIPRVPGKYREGIQGTTGFIEAAVAGQSNYETKMADTAVLARRGKRLAQLTDADWKNPALEKGAARIGQGMTAGADKQSRNYEPYRSALEGTTLPARTTDPMANIDNRVKGVVRVMVDTKKAQLGE